MESMKIWTNSIGGVETSSGGPLQINYEIPWGESQFETHAGNIQSSPFFGLLVGTPKGYVFLAPKCRVDEHSVKRISACLGALAMPTGGVDEHLKSTVEEFNYWREMEFLPPPKEPDSLKVTCSVTRFNLRPKLVISD